MVGIDNAKRTVNNDNAIIYLLNNRTKEEQAIITTFRKNPGLWISVPPFYRFRLVHIIFRYYSGCPFMLHLISISISPASWTRFIIGNMPIDKL
jgi:hypothetical protein